MKFPFCSTNRGTTVRSTGRRRTATRAAMRSSVYGSFWKGVCGKQAGLCGKILGRSFVLWGTRRPRGGGLCGAMVVVVVLWRDGEDGNMYPSCLDENDRPTDRLDSVGQSRTRHRPTDRSCGKNIGKIVCVVGDEGDEEAEEAEGRGAMESWWCYGYGELVVLWSTATQ